MFDKFYYVYDSGTKMSAYISHYAAQSQTEFFWLILETCDCRNFDFHWVPPYHQQGYVHAWRVGSNPLHYGIYLVPVNAATLMGICEYHWHNEVDSVPLFQPRGHSGWTVLGSSAFNYEPDPSWLPDTNTEFTCHSFLYPGTESVVTHSYVLTGHRDAQSEKKHKCDTTTLAIRTPIIHQLDEVRIDKLDPSGYNRYMWVISPFIDYSGFDFDWLPEEWDSESVHCFVMDGCQQTHFTYLTKIDNFQVHWNFRLNSPPEDFIVVSDEKTYNVLSKTANRIYHKSNLKFKHIPIYNSESEVDQLSDDPYYWIVDQQVDYGSFNFNWLPEPWEDNYVHCWAMKGTKQNAKTFLRRKGVKSEGYIYHPSNLSYLPGYSHKVMWPETLDFDEERDWLDNMCHIALDLCPSTDEPVWILDPAINYSKFDFSFDIDVWDEDRIHTYGSPELGPNTTWRVRRSILEKMIGLTIYGEPHSVNTLTLDKPKIEIVTIDVFGHGDHAIPESTRVYQMFDGFRSVIKTAILNCQCEWLWALPNNMHYDKGVLKLPSIFDGIHNMHIINSSAVLVHIPTARAVLSKNDDVMSSGVNWCNSGSIRRLVNWPVVRFSNDSMADAIRSNPRSIAKYTLYILDDSNFDVEHITSSINFSDMELLWSVSQPPIIKVQTNGMVALVPNNYQCEAGTIWESKYPVIIYLVSMRAAMDIVFISNGEPNAMERYKLWQQFFPEIKHSSGVTGRLASYQAAAKMSSSPWFLAVFAKTVPSEEMASPYRLAANDVMGSIDYFAEPRHYIFHNLNSDINVVYGHMAPVMYNKNMILNHPGDALDITLSQPHVTIPLLCSKSSLESTGIVAWRTAFREVCKLIYAQQTQVDTYSSDISDITQDYILARWLSANGWLGRGASDAAEYMKSEEYSTEAVMRTVEWKWLDSYFEDKYEVGVDSIS